MLVHGGGIANQIEVVTPITAMPRNPISRMNSAIKMQLSSFIEYATWLYSAVIDLSESTAIVVAVIRESHNGRHKPFDAALSSKFANKIEYSNSNLL